MSFINADYSKNQENSFEPLPEGNYEVLIQQAQERTTQNGAESLQLRLVVRNDLDAALPDTNGKYHNRVIFMDNWKRKKTNQYDMDGLQYILEAAKIPEGTQLNSVDDFCNALKMKPVNVYTKIQKSDGYDPRNTIAPWGVSETDYPQVAHKFKNGDQDQVFNRGDVSDPFKNNGQPIDISNEDLPF